MPRLRAIVNPLLHRPSGSLDRFLSLDEAKNRLGHLLDLVESREEIAMTRRGSKP
jgi:hypothetical protein